MSWSDIRARAWRHAPAWIVRWVAWIGWPHGPALPARMTRVALVAADDSLRDVLVRVAGAAAVEIGQAAGGPGPAPGPADEAASRLRRSGHPGPERRPVRGASRPRHARACGPL